MKLHLQKLQKTFPQGRGKLTILNDLSLELESGEIGAIIGESGSGKSTLLSLLAGFEQPDSGKILWETDEASSWNEDEWALFRRRHLGFVFQNYHLIPYLNALENVALPLRLLNHPDPEAPAAQLLTQLGLGERFMHLSSELSGGECQRVAIARALIHEPKLLLADEPTGSLDQKTGTQVLDMLFHQLTSRKQTALIVTHSNDVASRCHKVFSLRDGRLWPQ